MVLPVCLVLVTFITRKVLLAITHPIPIETAMIISGLWVENMEDMFQVFAFPSVREPSTFAMMWAVTAVSNLLNLLFLCDGWFRFRIWVKEFLKRVFTCGKGGSPCTVAETVDLEDVADERGHSNNRPGYQRRQLRFFFWKLFSQACAMVFYLISAAVLRFGVNKDDFPFNAAELDADKFANSMIFAGGNFVFVVVCGVVSHAVVKRLFPDLLQSLGGVFHNLVRDQRFAGFAIALAISNGILAISLVSKQANVWYAWGAPKLSPCEN
jgi:hypothetical protein